MANRIARTTEELPLNIKNAVIELVEEIDEKDGFEPNPDFDPDLDYVLMCVESHRKGVNYRRMRQKKDGNILKALNNVSAETKAAVLAKLGIKE